MARVSVLVPVYNVEEYLPECLASLAAQTLDDIEIVCVDDGSTDASGTILADAARRDRRIRIIRKPNGGLSSARNAGLDAARSPYVCFLDADDRYVGHACARIVEALDASGADVLTFGGTAIPPEASYPWLESVLSPRDITYEAFSPDILFKESARPFTWRTACRTELLRETGLRFDETAAFGEDQIFDFALYPRAGRTKLISDRLYEYRVGREGSLMSRMMAEPAEMLSRHVEIVRRVCDDWEGIGILGRYGAEMVAWSVEFVLYDALRLDEDDRLRVDAEMADVLLSHWDAAQLEHELRLARPVRLIVSLALSGRRVSTRRLGLLASRYYRWRYGLRTALANRLRR